MSLDYDYYGNYDPDCGDEIDLEGQIRDWLGTMDLLAKFVNIEKPEILDLFVAKVASKYKSDLRTNSYVLSDVGLDRLLRDQSVLGSHENLKDLSLQLIMKYMRFREGYTLSEEKELAKWFDYCQAKYMLLYHGITSLVEILGREEGIQFYKDFVEYRGQELSKKGKGKVPFQDTRKAWVKGWASGGMEFGVVDFDEHMYLCKFDKCVSHESMKHVEDQELAYYAVCYSAPRIQKYLLENVRLRRSVTLFTGDFCDELRWDPHVHDEPEQPSHEFSRSIIPK
ncbi:MAG: L-2-amino-thiazoline-4-carboxylic acid hydrolase [Candidatus Hodarchaeota archaeon]